VLSVLYEAESYLDRVGMLHLPGAVLFSSFQTLKPGPVYLLGLNPGGSEGATLKDSIDKSREGNNAYLDERWAPSGRLQPKGKSTLQRRVQHLCRMIGVETRDVPASNLAFTRSTRVGMHNDFGASVQASLPVHEMFLSAIQPSFVMTFGSVDNFAQAGKLSNLESRLADHGSWKAHRGEIDFGGRRIAFGNIPHMSLWASDSREHIVAWAIEGRTRAN
jgi:hypothetical protein